MLSRKVMDENPDERIEKFTTSKNTFDNNDTDEMIKKYILEEDKEKGRKLDQLIFLLRKYFGGYFYIGLMLFLVTIPHIFSYIGINYLYTFIKN